MNKTTLKKYAEVVVKVGANVQKGQAVVISTSPAQEEFAYYLAKECYKAKAKNVTVEFQSTEIRKLYLKNVSQKEMEICDMP